MRAAVRAESVRVTAAATGCAGRARPGTLAGISFLGDVIQYVVLTASGLELLARTAPNQARAPLHRRHRCWCSWDDSDLLVFPQDAVGRRRRAGGVMAPRPDIRALIPEGAAEPRITRRALLSGFVVAGAGLALAGCSRETALRAHPRRPDGKIENQLNVYSWGDYDDPGEPQRRSARPA